MRKHRQRREFISAIATNGLIAGTASRLPAILASSGSAQNDDPWSVVPRILSRIRPPVFPQRYFAVCKSGAAGDNKTDCTEAFAAAIKACN